MTHDHRNGLSYADDRFAPVIGEMLLLSDNPPYVTSGDWDEFRDPNERYPHEDPVKFNLPENASELLGGSIISNLYLQTMTMDGTTTPPIVRIHIDWPPAKHAGKLTRTSKFPEPDSKRLLNEIRKITGLTLEEIAPLMAVSRRSLQHWLAGGKISARKELRLRSVRDILLECNQSNHATNRTFIFEKRTGGVRVYDLLVEGRFDAVASFAGKRPYMANTVAPSNLLARLDLLEDSPVGTGGKTIPRLSRRLRRRENLE